MVGDDSAARALAALVMSDEANRRLTAFFGARFDFYAAVRAIDAAQTEDPSHGTEAYETERAALASVSMYFDALTDQMREELGTREVQQTAVGSPN